MESPATSWQMEAPDLPLAAAGAAVDMEAVGLAAADVLEEAAGELGPGGVPGAQAANSNAVQASKLHGFFTASSKHSP
ncbi:hypothetical protein ASF74_11715 [Arthrobacter sp. Leaf145]|nr:hypothetical protein ASF74_11715 [Arthrobacter sp. Leaf145]